MVTKPALVLLFALAFAFFILVPPFLTRPFPPYGLMHWADVLDVATPLFLLPLYWLLFTDAGRIRRSRPLVLVFLVLGALWAEGQGMHLSANSIGNLLGAGASPVHDLVHFYDEVLSHYLWHAAVIGLSILLVAVRTDVRAGAARMPWALMVPAVALYGFTYFADINEGGTVPLGLPAAVSIPVAILLARREDLRRRNLTAFFFWSYVVAVIFFAGWFAYWRGFPEFSEVGIL